MRLGEASQQRSHAANDRHQRIRHRSKGIAKGNAGIPKYHDGHIHYDGTPDLMAEYAVLARDAGATIIGGCCGTMPEHLKAMREALETRPRGPRPSLEAVSQAMGGFSSATDGTGDDAGAPVRKRRRG